MEAYAKWREDALLKMQITMDNLAQFCTSSIFDNAKFANYRDYLYIFFTNLPFYLNNKMIMY